MCFVVTNMEYERQNPANNNKIPERKKPKTNKRTLDKIARVKGEPFSNYKGIAKPARFTGPDCRCARLKCFEKILEDTRNATLTKFNMLESKDAQDSHLAGLISFCPPRQRRSRKRHQDVPQDNENHEVEFAADEPLLQKHQHLASFKYKIKDGTREVLVCAKAFCSIYGISKERLRRIRLCLVKTGKSPQDRRGHHANKPRKTDGRVYTTIRDHIKSFKCRQSHYSRRDNPNIYYLPETLSCKKMYKIFCEENEDLRVSYKVYWQVFTREFKLKFGVPKSDTCGICDNLMQQMNLETDMTKKADLKTEKKLHLCKAEKFYQLKKHYRKLARQHPDDYSCISFDFMQNLPVPHIRTNEVFLRHSDVVLCFWYT